VRGLLDTSICVGDEHGRARETDRLPDEAAVSVVTLAVLELGVQLASDEIVRAQRLRTLRATHRTYVALPIDESVTSACAELIAVARQAGRRARVMDAWIAATARAHDVAVYTKDADFDDLAVAVVQV